MIYYFAVRLGGLNGADQAAADVLTCLRATGLPITVVCRERSHLPEQVDNTELSRVNWLRPPRYPSLPKLQQSFLKDTVKWLLYNLQDLPLRYGLRRYLRHHKPDLAVFNDMIPPPRLAAQLEQITKVAIVHDSPESLRFYYGAREDNSAAVRLVEGWVKTVAEVFDEVVFVSPQARDEWLAFKPLADKETYVISNCCREDAVQQLLQQGREATRQKLGIDKGQFVVVCVASMQPRKGQDVLVEALAKVVKNMPELSLYLVGPGEPNTWAKTLRERVAATGLTEQVKFMGPRKDALAFTAAADVLVLPSRAEAQGIAILEAMALKVPVIASDVGGIPDMIKANHSGLLFPVGDVDKLAANLKNLYDAPMLRQTLAQRAFETYGRRFSKREQIRRYQEALEKMLTA